MGYLGFCKATQLVTGIARYARKLLVSIVLGTDMVPLECFLEGGVHLKFKNTILPETKIAPENQWLDFRF